MSFLFRKKVLCPRCGSEMKPTGGFLLPRGQYDSIGRKRDRVGTKREVYQCPNCGNRKMVHPKET